MSSIQSQFKKTVKGLGRQAVKQIFEEPLEMARTAGRQVSGVEKTTRPENESLAGLSPKPQEGKPISLEEDKARAQSMLSAYNKELADIGKQNSLKEIQQRIAEGKTFVIENLDGFSIEEKQVLKAQQEVVQQRILAQESQKPEFTEPSTRRKVGMKGRIGQLKKRSEGTLRDSV